MKIYTRQEVEDRLNEIQDQLDNSITEERMQQINQKLINFNSLMMLKRKGFFSSDSDEENELWDLGYRPLNIDTEYIDWDKTVVYISDDPIKSGKGPHLIVKDGMISGIRSSHPYNIKQGTIVERVEVPVEISEAPVEPTYMNMTVPTLEITFYFNPDDVEDTVDATLWNPMPGR